MLSAAGDRPGAMGRHARPADQEMAALSAPGFRVIIRVFLARVHPGKEEEFAGFVRGTGLPMVEAQPGCSQAAWGRSLWGDRYQFVVVTHWDSVASLEAFAGPSWREPVIEPSEVHLLAEVVCGHYEADEAR